MPLEKTLRCRSIGKIQILVIFLRAEDKMDASWLNKPFLIIRKARDQEDDLDAVGSSV